MDTFSPLAPQQIVEPGVCVYVCVCACVCVRARARVCLYTQVTHMDSFDFCLAVLGVGLLVVEGAAGGVFLVPYPYSR